MDPTRKEVVNGRVVREYYWAGSLPVYLDYRLVVGKSFDEVVDAMKKGEPVELAEI